VKDYEHVGVRPDTWITEQVPRAANGITRFQNAPTGLGAMHLQMLGSPNARQAGTHNQNIEGRAVVAIECLLSRGVHF
jgi:hypothetical protein